jgi:phage gpG-like protein
VASAVVDRDLGLKAIVEQLKEGATVRVGVLGSDAAVTPEGSRLSMAQIATVHEFGSSDGKIPQRSFLRSTFDEKAKELEQLISRAIGKAIKSPGSISVAQIVGLAGQRYLDLVKAKIRSKIDPPLSPRTLAKRLQKIHADANTTQRKKRAAELQKQFDETSTLPAESVTPLIDTGRLIGSLTTQVVLGKGGK